MGFWHTGYIDFHAPTGLDGVNWETTYPCAHCDKTYDLPEQLLKHTFEAHPLPRPIMFLEGRELGTTRVRIARRLSPSDVRVGNCDRARLNGNEVSPASLGRALANISSPSVCRVLLSKGGVDAPFELDIHVASKPHLAGVEKKFDRTARAGWLDTLAIYEFSVATSAFGSASEYSGGVCDYLYGVLAKEREPDFSIPYEAYKTRFARAAEELEAFDRPLARVIRSLIEFNYNHFRESARLSPNSRVGRVAHRYTTWIESGRSERIGSARLTAPRGLKRGKHHRGHRPTEKPLTTPDTLVQHLDALVTDRDTEQILSWATRSLTSLSKNVDEIETVLNRGDLDEVDKVKLRVLLAECYVSSGQFERAKQHAKVLRNMPDFEKWADTIMRSSPRDYGA